MSQSLETKINLKTLTAQELLSKKQGMYELFQLLDDDDRHTLIMGDTKKQELKLNNLNHRLNALKQQLGK